MYLPLIAASGPDGEGDDVNVNSPIALPLVPQAITTTTDNNNDIGANQGNNGVEDGMMVVVQTDTNLPPPSVLPRRRRRQWFAEDVVPVQIPSSSSSAPAPAMLTHVPHPSNRTVTRASPICIGAFHCHHLRNIDSCRAFLQRLSRAQCVSFEFLYRRVPVAVVPIVSVHSNSNSACPGLSQGLLLSQGTGLAPALALDTKIRAQKDVARRWSRLLAWSCPKSSNATVGGVNNAICLMSVATVSKDKGKSKAYGDPITCERTQVIDPHVLAGVAIGFGDDCGFYLPLPCLLPLMLPTSQARRDHDSLQHRGHHHHAKSGLPHQNGSGPNRVSLDGMDKLCQLTARLSAEAASGQRLGEAYAKNQGLCYGFTDRDPTVLICRYVGFPLIFDSCPSLRKARTGQGQGLDHDGPGLGQGSGGTRENHSSNDNNSSSRSKSNGGLRPARSFKEWQEQQNQLLQQQQQQHGNSNNSNDNNSNGNHSNDNGNRNSNPLMSVSRYWAAACRAAMALEWRRGACVEWQILSEIMSNSTVTKVRELSSHILFSHILFKKTLSSALPSLPSLPLNASYLVNTSTHTPARPLP